MKADEAHKNTKVVGQKDYDRLVQLAARLGLPVPLKEESLRLLGLQFPCLLSVGKKLGATELMSRDELVLFILQRRAERD